jgi:type I restriction enzyme M protein
MDYLEGIVALPDQLFYNTGISTYFWILSNRKRPASRDKVVLVDARDQWEKMRKSLGDKRKQIASRRSITSPMCTPAPSTSPPTRSTPTTAA